MKSGKVDVKKASQSALFLVVVSCTVPLSDLEAAPYTKPDLGFTGQVGSASSINNSRQVAQNQIVNRSEQALKLTVIDGDYDDVERELNNKKWSADDLGMALLAAAGRNKPRVAALLLTSGANPNYSVLYLNGVAIAALENNPEVLEVLLERGADPNWKATFDWRPLHFAIKGNKSFDRVLLLLLKHGATVDATTNLLITPLHRAAGFCRGSAVEILLQHGASKKLRDKYGQTATQRAVKSGCNEIASLLKPSEDLVPIVNPFEHEGRTRYYTDPGYEFSIEYPDNWEVIPGREPVTKLKVAGPLGQTCSVIVADNPMAKNIPAKKVIAVIMKEKFFENGIFEKFEGATLIDKNSVYLSNTEAVLIVFSYLYKTLGINVEMTVMIVTTWKDGKMFRVLCTTDTSTFAQSSETFRRVIRSFVIPIR